MPIKKLPALSKTLLMFLTDKALLFLIYFIEFYNCVDISSTCDQRYKDMKRHLEKLPILSVHISIISSM